MERLERTEKKILKKEVYQRQYGCDVNKWTKYERIDRDGEDTYVEESTGKGNSKKISWEAWEEKDMEMTGVCKEDESDRVK